MGFRLLSVGNVIVAFVLSSFTSAMAQQVLGAARKEGQVVFYASMEAQSAQRLSAAFEAACTGINAPLARAIKQSHVVFMMVVTPYRRPRSVSQTGLASTRVPPRSSRAAARSS